MRAVESGQNISNLDKPIDRPLPHVKPLTPETYDLLCSVWIEFYGYPLEWSVEASKLDGDIGQEHRNRLHCFEHMIREQNSQLPSIDPKKG